MDIIKQPPAITNDKMLHIGHECLETRGTIWEDVLFEAEGDEAIQ